MIEVDELHKTFGAVTALRGLSFQAPDGAITGLLGANGAGKTTTLRMIAGVLKPQGGRIRVDGARVERARASIASARCSTTRASMAGSPRARTCSTLEVCTAFPSRAFSSARTNCWRCCRWVRPPTAAPRGSRRASA